MTTRTRITTVELDDRHYDAISVALWESHRTAVARLNASDSDTEYWAGELWDIDRTYRLLGLDDEDQDDAPVGKYVQRFTVTATSGRTAPLDFGCRTSARARVDSRALLAWRASQEPPACGCQYRSAEYVAAIVNGHPAEYVAAVAHDALTAGAVTLPVGLHADVVGSDDSDGSVIDVSLSNQPYQPDRRALSLSPGWWPVTRFLAPAGHDEVSWVVQVVVDVINEILEQLTPVVGGELLRDSGSSTTRCPDHVPGCPMADGAAGRQVGNGR